MAMLSCQLFLKETVKLEIISSSVLGHKVYHSHQW